MMSVSAQILTVSVYQAVPFKYCCSPLFVVRVPFSREKQTVNLGNEVGVVGMSWCEQPAVFSPAMTWFSLMVPFSGEKQST